jgi:Amt family ammonium transporter
LGIQAIVNVTTVVFSGLMTFVLFKIIDKLVGIRVTAEDEAIGLDISQHGEIAYSEGE